MTGEDRLTGGTPTHLVRSPLLREGALAQLTDLVLSFSWIEDVPLGPGPPFHLAVTLLHHGEVILEMGITVRDGRMGPSQAEPREVDDLEGSLRLDLERWLDLLDPTTTDPLLAVLAPPTQVEMSFDGLLYFGGMAEMWVPALRAAVDADLVAACRRQLGGPSAMAERRDDGG